MGMRIIRFPLNPLTVSMPPMSNIPAGVKPRATFGCWAWAGEVHQAAMQTRPTTKARTGRRTRVALQFVVMGPSAPAVQRTLSWHVPQLDQFRLHVRFAEVAAMHRNERQYLAARIADLRVGTSLGALVRRRPFRGLD